MHQRLSTICLSFSLSLCRFTFVTFVTFVAFVHFNSLSVFRLWPCLLVYIFSIFYFYFYFFLFYFIFLLSLLLLQCMHADCQLLLLSNAKLSRQIFTLFNTLCLSHSHTLCSTRDYSDIYIYISIDLLSTFISQIFFSFFHNSLFPSSSSSSFSFLPPSFYPIPSSFSSHWSYLVLPATDSIHFFFHTHTHTFLTHLSTGFFLFSIFPFLL